MTIKSISAKSHVGINIHEQQDQNDTNGNTDETSEKAEGNIYYLWSANILKLFHDFLSIWLVLSFHIWNSNQCHRQITVQLLSYIQLHKDGPFFRLSNIDEKLQLLIRRTYKIWNIFLSKTDVLDLGDISASFALLIRLWEKTYCLLKKKKTFFLTICFEF